MSLSPGHREELHGAGLSDETIAHAGLYSATEPGVRDVLGYGAGAGLVFPYSSLNGEPNYARVKLDHAGADGKRDRSPKGQPNRLYVPPLLDRAVLADPAVPLYVTEGEKKGLKGCQEGLPCLSVAGVWSWRTKTADGRSRPIQDLDHVVRAVVMVLAADGRQARMVLRYIAGLIEGTPALAGLVSAARRRRFT